MHPADPNVGIPEAVIERQGPLADEMVFVGGCATGLLITDPAAPGIRPARDVEVLVEIVSHRQYHQLASRLRSRGFREDHSEDTHIARWRADLLVLDVMPTDAAVLGFGNRWHTTAFDGAPAKFLAGRARGPAHFGAGIPCDETGRVRRPWRRRLRGQPRSGGRHRRGRRAAGDCRRGQDGRSPASRAPGAAPVGTAAPRRVPRGPARFPAPRLGCAGSAGPRRISPAGSRALNPGSFGESTDFRTRADRPRHGPGDGRPRYRDYPAGAAPASGSIASPSAPNTSLFAEYTAPAMTGMRTRKPRPSGIAAMIERTM